MKNSTRLLASATLLVAVSLAAVLVGCKYDVEAPLWEKPYTMPATPTITQVQPASAPAGVNTIVFTGQNLGSVPATNGVYFGVTPVEIVQKSATSITVRRPNLVTDSCTVKVVPDSTLTLAKVAFGKIDRVMDRYGSFVDAITLAAVAADSAGNLIVVSGVSPIIVWRITPDGSKTMIAWSGTQLRPPTDAIVKGSDMYLPGNNREIQKVNLTTGTSSAWTRMPSGKVMKFGDFDTTGYFYAGGATGADLCIVPPNPPATLTLSGIKLSGFYAAEDVLAIRYFQGYLYVASKASGASAKIWRHSVSSGGTLGMQEPVLNLGAHTDFSSRMVRAISLSSTGELFITTDAVDPLLVYNPTRASLDYFYKSIVPPNGKHAFWGNSIYLYLVSGDVENTDGSLQWNVARVNMGTTGISRQ